jgi:DNA-binding IclR family transcriptional regulator
VGNGGTRAATRAPRRRGRGRPRGTGKRAQQALELVRARPGITISELAESMGIHANYLYRVMPTLESEGQVVKRDRGWHPA